MDEEHVNLYSAQFLSNLFHVLFSAAKSCLLPFITLYFRQLGLSASQVGVIMGLKALLWLFFAPLWSQWAKRYNKRRVVLMLSIFVMMASNLGLTLVPPVSVRQAFYSCRDANGSLPSWVLQADINQGASANPPALPEHVNSYNNITTVIPTQKLEHDTVTEKSVLSIISTTKRTTTASTTDSTTTSTTTTFTPTTTIAVKTKKSDNSHRDKHRDKRVTDTGKHTSEVPQVILPIASSESTGGIEDNFRKTRPSSWNRHNNERQHDPYAKSNKSQKDKIDVKDDSSSDEEDKSWLKDGKLTDEDINNLLESMIKGTDNDDNGNVFEADAVENANWDALDNDNGDENDNHVRNKRDIFQSTFTKIDEKFSELKNEIRHLKNRTFILVLLLILIGELFSAPADKLADDSWYDFLDNMDESERYGRHNIWSWMGYASLPVVVTGIIYASPCILNLGVHHFMIHFYIFSAIMGVAFLSAYFYPMMVKEKRQTRTKIFKGIRSIFYDCHCFAFTMTMFVNGFLTAGMYNFLMWQMQDKEAPELVMGLGLSVGALSNVPFLFLYRPIVTRLTHTGTVVVAFCVMAVRFIVYSFMWTPWLVVGLEILNGATYTLMWRTIQSYGAFRVNTPHMERSTYAILMGLHEGLGFGIGSLLSGVFADILGLATLFQGSGIIAVVWCIILVTIQKSCRKKTDVRYMKLVPNEDESDDNSDDDWLEKALQSKT